MTNEEMENRMEFLLKQQESFADSQREIYQMLHNLAERQDKFQGQQERTDKAVTGLVAVVGIVVESQQAAAESQKATAQSQQAIAESQKASNERVAELSERLNIFINVLENYVSRNRNGENPNQN